MFEELKKSWLVPAFILLVLVFVVVKKGHFSFTDMVASRVIERLNLDYSPYGPPPPVPDGAK